MQVTGDHAHVEINAPYNDVTGNQYNNYYSGVFPEMVDLGRECCLFEFASCANELSQS